MKTRQQKSQAGRLRIVAGKWRSRLLQVADAPGLRPTSERIRETLFNWLTPHLPNARCLDLCAGTGALGIEALSRGAESVVFVEASSLVCRTLRSNLADLGAHRAAIENTDAATYLRSGSDRGFDIVFLDPPFADDLLDELCRLLAAKGWLNGNARIYIELSKEQPLPDLPRDWQIARNKTGGNVRYMLVTPDSEVERN